jgi:hypothetical protein
MKEVKRIDIGIVVRSDSDKNSNSTSKVSTLKLMDTGEELTTKA